MKTHFMIILCTFLMLFLVWLNALQKELKTEHREDEKKDD